MNRSNQNLTLKVNMKVFIPLLFSLFLFSCSTIKEIQLIAACEQKSTRILLLDPTQTWPQGEVWSWHPSDSAEIKKEQRKWFSYLTDSKKVVINGEEHLLTSASGGGIALIRRKDKKAIFHAYAGHNAHSIAMLPDGNIVTACSTPNHLSLLSRNGNKMIKYPLKSAHGLVWDDKYSCLWALGYKTLKCYDYHNGKLSEKSSHELPDDGGHDLSRQAGSEKLFVTTHHGIWLFNCESKNFSPFKDLAKMKHVKSISQHSQSKQIISVKAEEKWWSDKVRVLGRESKVYPGARFYKARWWQ